MDPGETKTFHIKLTKPGVFPVLLHELLLRAASGDAGLSRGVRRQAKARANAAPSAERRPRRRTIADPNVRRRTNVPSSLQARRIMNVRKVSNLLGREFRFLARPLNLWSRLLLLAGGGDDRYVALFPALENASGRAAIFRWTRSVHLQLQNPRRRIEWPAPGRDQQPQSLHRHGADRAGGFSWRCAGCRSSSV